MPKQNSRRRSNREGELVDSVDQSRDACAHIAAIARLMADCSPTVSVDAEVIIRLGAMLGAETEQLRAALESMTERRS